MIEVVFVVKTLVFSANAGTISRAFAADNQIFYRKLVVYEFTVPTWFTLFPVSNK